MPEQLFRKRPVIFTIGHSNLEIDRFVAALEHVGVVLLVDVRSLPYSRFTPQFNRESLQKSLAVRGIDYRFAGDLLGGRPTDPSCYKSGELPGDGADYLNEVDYLEVAKRPWFKRGIDRLLELATENSTTIMCSEEDPATCHRYHLITQSLLPHAEVQDIRTNMSGPIRVVSAVPLPTQLTLL